VADAVVTPDWNLPAGVHAFVTTRHGGHSSGAHASFNLGLHVDDDADAVARNRASLKAELERRSGGTALQLQWLQQVHGTAVWEVTAGSTEPPPKADAAYTTQSGIVLSVMTADCLPVLYCAKDGSEIAVAHAGWRGLCNGVLEAVVGKFKCAPADIRCWLGPAIGPCHFEVGDDVRQAFFMLSRGRDLPDTKAAFTPTKPDKWLADLYALARVRLRKAGIVDVTGDVQCTVCRNADYYSYRHAAVTGRFATGIVKV